VSSLSVIHLLAPQDQDALVAHARAEVQPGGIVVLEMPVASPARAARPWSLNSTRSLGRARIEHHVSMNEAASGRWQTHWKFLTFLDDACVREVERTFDWAPLAHERTEALLSAHGLAIVDDFGGYDRSPYVAGESRVRLVVARAN
jgi:hypothetical protein